MHQAFRVKRVGEQLRAQAVQPPGHICNSSLVPGLSAKMLNTAWRALTDVSKGPTAGLHLASLWEAIW